MQRFARGCLVRKFTKNILRDMSKCHEAIQKKNTELTKAKENAEKEKRDSENYREYYTHEVRDIISDHYKLDIQIGGYEF